jgi:hypothetical protein
MVLKNFPENRGVAGIVHLEVDCIADVIKKGLETGIAVAFRGLLGALGKPGQKCQDFILGEGINLPVTKFVLEPSEKEFIILQRIFFSNLPCGTLDTIGWLGLLSCCTSLNGFILWAGVIGQPSTT